MLAREVVYAMLTKENEYAQGWAKGKKSVETDVPDHMVSRKTGQAFGYMDWITFAEKYLDEAKLGYANFTPDERIIRIRLIKAASLLVNALQCHGSEADLEDIAGVSSTKYPIWGGGLKTFLDSGLEDTA